MAARPLTPVLLLLGAAHLAGCGDHDAGVRRLREGRVQEAHAVLAQAVAAEGETAAAALLHDAALASLRAGLLDEAADLAAWTDGGAAKAGGDMVRRAASLRGHVSWALCDRAVQRAAAPDADPVLVDEALARAGEALDAFSRAAMAGGGAVSRRNAERALLRRDALRERASPSKRTTGGPPGPGAPGGAAPGGPGGGRPAEPPRVRPVPAPPPPPGPGGETPAEPTVPVAVELPADRVLGLLDRLDVMEKEKRAARIERHRRVSRDVEKDW